MNPRATVGLFLAAVISSCNSQHLQVDKINVRYEILYDDPLCFVDQSPVPSTSVMVDPQSTALNVMEAAVSGFDPTYRFSATYFGTGLGYFIDKLANVESDLNASCFWIYYIQSIPISGNPVTYPPNFGVSNFLIPAGDTTVLWRYQFTGSGNHTPPANGSNSTTPTVDPYQFVNDTDEGPDTFLINYVVSNSFECLRDEIELIEPVAVSIPRGGSALNVMENARDISRAFAFSATYFGVDLGYFIDQIGGVTSNGSCYWQFLYQPPGELPYPPSVGVSNFVLPVNRGTIILSYSMFSDDSPSSMPTEQPSETEEEVTTMMTDGTGYVQPSLITITMAICTVMRLFY